MLLNIDADAGTATVVGEKKCALMEAVDRFREELEDWKKYKEMGRTQERFAPVSVQEFQHAMMAASDILTHLWHAASEAERVEIVALLDTVRKPT